MIREYCHRDPLKMTWWVFHDHLTRLLPYMTKMRAGTVKPEDVAALEAPMKVPKVK